MCRRKVLEKWLGPADNWEEQFDSIDMTNKKGEDAVLFVVIEQSVQMSGFQKFSFFVPFKEQNFSQRNPIIEILTFFCRSSSPGPRTRT